MSPAVHQCPRHAAPSAPVLGPRHGLPTGTPPAAPADQLQQPQRRSQDGAGCVPVGGHQSKRCGPPGIATAGGSGGARGRRAGQGLKHVIRFSLPMRTVTLLRLPSCPLTYRSSALRLVDRNPAKQEL